MSAGISQRSVPGVSRLYSDYLYDFARVEEFYPGGAALDVSRLEQVAQEAAENYPTATRERMTAALARQNPGDGASARQLELLRQPQTVAVVTGQQVGLFGGPLLTVFKAMNAVLLCERLRAAGVAAVPIFWMATQDHDLAEVDHAWALDAESTPVCHRAALDAAPGSPAGRARLGDDIPALLDAVVGAGADASVRAAYQPGASLAQAFGSLLRAWFAPWGLLTFDPEDAPEAHAVWQPIYQAAFERQPELAQRLSERGARLQAAGYHVQVEQTPAASMLFLERDGRRLGLRRRGAGWLLGEEPIAASEIATAIAQRPASMSPAALLRPLLQDAWFPTLAQITGPAETAYFAQSAVLYAALGVREPVAWPRATATLLDAKTRRLLEKYELTADELWRAPADELLARRALPAGIERQTAAMRQHFEADFTALEAQWAALDPTLGDAAVGAAQKIRHQMEQIETRVARSFARRSGELAGHARHLSGHLFPNRQLPERLLAGASFAPLAPDWLAQIHAQLDPATADHQWIALESVVSVKAG